jgi:hypothetical protein
VFKRKSKSAKPAKAAKKKKKEKKPREKVAKPAAAIALKKQPFDVYTVMLIVSLAAILIASTLLLLELQRYGEYPWWKAV